MVKTSTKHSFTIATDQKVNDQAHNDKWKVPSFGQFLPEVASNSKVERGSAARQLSGGKLGAY